MGRNTTAGAPPPQLRHGGITAAQHRRAWPLFWLELALRTHTNSFAPRNYPSTIRTRACQRAPPRRAVAAIALTAQTFPVPTKVPRWTTRSAGMLPDPRMGRIDPWSAGLGVSGEPAATEPHAGGVPPPPPPAKHPSH